MDIFSNNEKLILWISAWLGALCCHMLSMYSDNFDGTQPFLKKFFPNHSEKFYVRINAIILPLIGAFLSIVLFEPTNIKGAVVAGLSWTGTLLALLKGKK